MQDSVFTKIIKREIPAEILEENDELIVILSIGPLNPGHVLVISKEQIESVWDLSEPLYQTVMRTSSEWAKKLEKYTDKPKVGMFVMGFGVPHAHVHIAPITEQQMEPLEKDIQSAKPETLANVAEQLRKL